MTWSIRQVTPTGPARALAGVVLLLACACGNGRNGPDLSMYEYRDTRNLVRFVHDAALLAERDPEAIEYLASHRERYCPRDHYLYVYETDGTNVFHAGMEYLEGRELADATDVDGRVILDMIREALDDPGNPHAWVHYTWWEPGGFYPVPKSSCHFLATTPDGRDLIVGGGIDHPLEEREFARIIVDRAADLYENQGPAALEGIEDPASGFGFREVRVFAFRSDGSVVISPVLSESAPDMDLLAAMDRAGNQPFALALGSLEAGDDSTWQVFLERSRYERQPVKKALYVRRAVFSGDTLFFAAITDLPMPP
ncbi:cache domain-containing protein [Candidatus Fermentibacterales bacterium]|nr:cache domain-containing protein [Candidatus Fermentibacterales bacterium]